MHGGLSEPLCNPSRATEEPEKAPEASEGPLRSIWKPEEHLGKEPEEALGTSGSHQKVAGNSQEAPHRHPGSNQRKTEVCTVNKGIPEKK